MLCLGYDLRPLRMFKWFSLVSEYASRVVHRHPPGLLLWGQRRLRRRLRRKWCLFRYPSISAPDHRHHRGIQMQAAVSSNPPGSGPLPSRSPPTQGGSHLIGESLNRLIRTRQWPIIAYYPVLIERDVGVPVVNIVVVVVFALHPSAICSNLPAAKYLSAAQIKHI